MELGQKIVQKSSEFTDKLLEGTQFAGDQEVRALLDKTKKDFRDILDTEPGMRLVDSIEKLGKKIKTEASFRDSVRVIFRLVCQAASSPIVKFGLFLFGIGALIAIVGSLPIVAESALATWVVKLLAWLAPTMCGLCGITYNIATGGANCIKAKIKEFFSETNALTSPIMSQSVANSGKNAV